MHSQFILALFAAGAIAQPYREKRGDVVVQTETEVKTVIVTAGGAPAGTGGWTQVTSAPQAPAPAPAAPKPKHGHAHAHLHAANSGANANANANAGASSGSPDTTGSSAYQDIVLTHHNVHRANHSADPLTWDDDMANLAQAEASVCVFAHNVTGSYGQNIAAGVSPERVSEAITSMFYNNEEPYFTYYGEANPTANFESWGHFSQLVWKGTTGVGCATVHCPGGIAEAEGTSPYFTVCNYSPAGNWGGEYAQNIGSPLGHPTVDADYMLSEINSQY